MYFHLHYKYDMLVVKKEGSLSAEAIHAGCTLRSAINTGIHTIIIAANAATTWEHHLKLVQILMVIAHCLLRLTYNLISPATQINYLYDMF